MPVSRERERRGAATTPSYDRLDADKVALTLERLRDRIRESFPDRHLADVADEVRTVVDRVDEESDARAPWLVAARVASRTAIGLLVVLIVVAVVSAVRAGLAQVGEVEPFDWLQIVESGVNDVVFAGVAIYFLRSLPDRAARRRNLASLHRLRSLAHIVDMHQTSKPSEVLLARPGASPPPGDDAMNPDELRLYYGFCSELLSLTSKAAALCAEASTDPVVLDTVSEIENLTTGMSRKIWQKISLLLPSSPPLA